MLIIFIVSSSVISHPHVFIDNSLKIVFDQNGLSGINVNWIFDEAFSSLIIQDCDLDKDNTFDEKEIKKVKKDYFKNLKDHEYFTNIKIDAEAFVVKKVADFSCLIKDGKVVYDFFVPCKVMMKESYKNVEISIFDKSYYVTAALAEKDPVLILGADFIDYSYEIADPPEDPMYYAETFTNRILLKFRNKK